MLQKLMKIIKNKKLVAILLIVGALLLVVATILFFSGRDKEPQEPPTPDSSESSPVESADSSSTSSTESSAGNGSSDSTAEGTDTGAEVSVVPAGPVTLVGTDISSIGLCVVLPHGTGIVDPNLPKGREVQYQPVTTLRNGKHSEVSLRFADNTIALSTMPIICLQGFELGDTPPGEALYQVEAEIKNSQSYSYGEISDKILYEQDGKLVLDVTFARSETPREAMEKRVAKFGGKPMAHPEGTTLSQRDVLADGSYIYKYDWMAAATEYLRGNIAGMIAPIQYATPHTLEELGYQFEMNGVSKAAAYMTVVSSATVKADAEGGHSGIYSAPVYGGERLLGGYTVLQPAYAEGETANGNPSSLALLQAFKRSELESGDAAIRFLRRSKPKSSSDDYYKIYTDGPFNEFSIAPELLENYVVFKDSDIVVYNFFDFAKAPPLVEQLGHLEGAEGYGQYSAQTADIAAAGNLLLSAPGGIGQYIRKVG